MESPATLFGDLIPLGCEPHECAMVETGRYRPGPAQCTDV